MEKIIIICLLFIGISTFTVSVSAQSDRKPWVDGTFPSIPSNQSYQFKIGKGDGQTLFEAQQKAVYDFLTGLPSVAQLDSKCQMEIVGDFITGEATDQMECDDTIYRKIKSLNARLDQYDYRDANGTYIVYYLFAYVDPSVDQMQFNPVTPTYTSNYGMSAGVRSIILPGWGQFHKGQIGRGVLLLGSFSALTATTLFYEKRRTDNSRLSKETTNIDFIREYRNRADQAQNLRNVAGISVIGIWIYNVIDAISAKGDLRYSQSHVQIYSDINHIGLVYTF